MRNTKAILPRFEYTENAGRLMRQTSLGGYPLYYVERDEWSHLSAVCPDCARITDEDEERPEIITAADANWEDTNLFCDACGERIPSAYAEEEDTDNA